MAFAANGPALFPLIGCVIAAARQLLAKPETPPEDRTFLLVCEVPLVLKAEFRATAAMIGGLVGDTLMLRVMAIGDGWQPPRLPL